MNELERQVLRRHRHRGERPFQRFGRCPSCRRVRDDERPRWLSGHRRVRLIFVECFDFQRAA
jgi:hypothetical protein